MWVQTLTQFVSPKNCRRSSPCSSVGRKRIRSARADFSFCAEVYGLPCVLWPSDPANKRVCKQSSHSHRLVRADRCSSRAHFPYSRAVPSRFFTLLKLHVTPPHRKQLTLVLSLPVRHQVYKKRESSRAGYTDATSNQIVPS